MKKEYLGKEGFRQLARLVRDALKGKQDTLTGTAGQAVGFDAGGNAAAAEVGGTNLLSGTRDFSGDWSYINQWRREIEKYRGLTVISRAQRWGGCGKAFSVTKGETYTLSFYVKANSETTFQAYFDGPQREVIISVSNKATTEWEKKVCVFRAVDDGQMRYVFAANDSLEAEDESKRTFFCGFKVERGSVATDWSPAPEDTDITEFGLSNLLPGTKDWTGEWQNASYWKDDGTYDKFSVKTSTGRYRGLIKRIQQVEELKQYTLSLYGKKTGNAVFNLVFTTDKTSAESHTISNVSDVWQRISYTLVLPEGTTWLEAKAENGSQEANDSDNTISVCGLKLERGPVAMDWSPAPEDKQDVFTGTAGQVVGFDSDGKAVAAKIGGTNLFSFEKNNILFFGNKPGTKDALTHTYSFTTTQTVPESEGFSANTPSSGRTILTQTIPPEDVSMTMSFMISASTPCRVELDLSDENNNKIFDLDSTPQKIILVKRNKNYVDNLVFFDMVAMSEIQESTTIKISNIKIERGTVATDWSPAPEDKADAAALTALEERIKALEAKLLA